MKAWEVYLACVGVILSAFWYILGDRVLGEFTIPVFGIGAGITATYYAIKNKNGRRQRRVQGWKIWIIGSGIIIGGLIYFTAGNISATEILGYLTALGIGGGITAIYYTVKFNMKKETTPSPV